MKKTKFIAVVVVLLSIVLITAIMVVPPLLSANSSTTKTLPQQKIPKSQKFFPQNELKKFLDKNVKKLKQAPAQCERKSVGSVPKDVIKRMMQKCEKGIQKKISKCTKNPGWHLDIQIDVKDKGGNEQFEELVCRGGCPGKGAGDTYPLLIKSEVLDVQDTAYEFVCSAACSSWQCETQAGQDQADSPDVQFEMLEYQGGRTTKCGSRGECIFTVAAAETPLSFELIFSSKKGFSQDLYPLKTWFRREPTKPGEGIAWGQEIRLQNFMMACGEPSADGKICYKTSGPIVLSGAHPGRYSVTLSDNTKNILYEGEKVVELK